MNTLGARVGQRSLGGVVGRWNVLEGSENGCHDSLGVLICVDSLVVLEKLFDQCNDHILIIDDVVERLNNAFVMVSETMRVGVR